MTNGFEKGGLLKRTSAFLLDGILLLLVAIGFAFLFAKILGYSTYSNIYTTGIERYAELYNIDFDKVVSQADYDALSEEEKASYTAAVEAMNSDDEIINAMNAIVKLIIAIAVLSLLFGFLILEFAVPLLLKNGRTLGKKAFGLAVIKKDGSDIGALPLLVRTFVGKYLIETMIPVLLIIITIFHAMGLIAGPGIIGFAIILILLLTNVVMLFATKNYSMIHDLVSDSVVIEFNNGELI